MANARRIILASASPRRKELLGKAGYPVFDILPSPAEELAQTEENVYRLALTNAVRKAEAVADLHPDALVIGADTLIEFENEAIGKPVDRDDAVRTLLRLSGKTHSVTTGVCICCRAAKVMIRFAESSFVEFLPFDRTVAEQYTAQVPVLDKAGSYAIQDHGDMLIREIRGDYDNIVGLPARRVREALQSIRKEMEE
ncbi:MAG: septum formation protein Maf [Lentisphaeria bacterium]|nr:septum formation protein Maf [Lentisphaeria bacterium]MBO5959534.1 septum formation protein Maf [Lentisphaeria bacterium]